MICLLLFLLSCENIVWKKGVSLPYKIEKGQYQFNIYELEYPDSLEEKELFLKKLEDGLTKIIKSGKRLAILLSEEFIKDHIHIEKFGILPEESFLRREASQLSSEEKSALFKYSGEKAEKPQNLLNLQVKYLLTLLGRGEEFNRDKLYTELYKGKLVDDISRIRNRIVGIFKQSLIHLFVKIDSIYRKDSHKEYEYKKHYPVKEIKVVRSSKFDNSYNKYMDKAVLVVGGVEDMDIEKILASELRVPLKEYLILNDRFNGYASRGSLIYLVGGDEKIQESLDYDILFNVVKVDIDEIDQKESKYVLSDLYKTKKQIESEKQKFLESLKKIKAKSSENKKME
ncbi:MAG TPA: hypothetical protein DEP20_02430 [Fusobacteria bacterium]|nr:hypothetical protein [Fusobacteriota bacterium]